MSGKHVTNFKIKHEIRRVCKHMPSTNRCLFKDLFTRMDADTIHISLRTGSRMGLVRASRGRAGEFSESSLVTRWCNSLSRAQRLALEGSLFAGYMHICL